MSLSFDNSINYEVYLGTWTNWSRGSVFGYTLTVNRAEGNLLIAFIAFFVAYVGTRLWRILCMASHSIGSSHRGREGYYHQRQAILRNASNPESGLSNLVQILWAWRSTSKGVWFAILPALALAILCVVGFAVASGFSSQISSSMGDEVLLKGTNCAWVDSTSPTLLLPLGKFARVWRPYEAQTWVTSSNYAEECYNQTGSPGVMNCGTFVQNRLQFTVNNTAGCPFSDRMCRTKKSNIFIDSGLLDSNDDFGINSAQDHRIQWRKVVHCAPLVTEGFKKDTMHAQSRPVTQYFYGKSRNIGEYHNFTYEYVNDQYWQLDLSAAGYTGG